MNQFKPGRPIAISSVEYLKESQPKSTPILLAVQSYEKKVEGTSCAKLLNMESQPSQPHISNVSSPSKCLLGRPPSKPNE